MWYLRIPDSPVTGTWPSVKIASGTTEDVLAVGDVNGDGLDDIVASDMVNGKTIYWYQNPGTGAGNWTRRTVGDVTDWADRVELVDINGDGRRDIVVSVEKGGCNRGRDVLVPVLWTRRPGVDEALDCDPGAQPTP
ncbi:MAG: VCBS repeat-containing protein [Rhodoferax sp.]|nr:VCBS repeat-containing protein [Rhodoferax sp.]